MTHTGLQPFLEPSALSQTTAAIFKPRSVLSRALERIELSDTGVVRKITLEFDMPRLPVLIPIAYPRRGILIDMLRIEASNDVAASTLDGSRTIQVTRHLLFSAASATTFGRLSPGIVSNACEAIPVAEPDEALPAIQKLREALKLAMRGSLTNDQVAFIRALQFFSYRRPLFVPCQPSGPILKVSYEMDLSHHEIRLYGVREGFRTSVGRLPDDLLFDIPLANRAQSYHFRAMAPARYYVRDTGCFARTSTAAAQTVKVRPWEVKPYAPQSRTSSGLRPDITGLCHVHMMDVGTDGRARGGLLLRLQLAEQPFGEIGSACVRLMATLVAIRAVDHFGRWLVIAPATAVVSLFIGLPAVLGVTFFLASGGIRGPLLARVGNLIAALGAVATSLTLIGWTVYAATRLKGDASATYVRAPGNVESSLVGLAILELIMFVICLCALALNATRFHRAKKEFMSRRRDNIDEA